MDLWLDQAEYEAMPDTLGAMQQQANVPQISELLPSKSSKERSKSGSKEKKKSKDKVSSKVCIIQSWARYDTSDTIPNIILKFQYYDSVRYSNKSSILVSLLRYNFLGVEENV